MHPKTRLFHLFQDAKQKWKISVNWYIIYKIESPFHHVGPIWLVKLSKIHWPALTFWLVGHYRWMAEETLKLVLKISSCSSNLHFPFHCIGIMTFTTVICIKVHSPLALDSICSPPLSTAAAAAYLRRDCISQNRCCRRTWKLTRTLQTQ